MKLRLEQSLNMTALHWHSGWQLELESRVTASELASDDRWHASHGSGSHHGIIRRAESGILTTDLRVTGTVTPSRD